MHVQFYAAFVRSVGYISHFLHICLHLIATIKQKLDDLILAVATIREGQSTNQHNLDKCFKKLKEDVTAAQEDATEQDIKTAKRE